MAKPDIEICELLAVLTKSVTLHTTGHVNGVTEETVTRHCQPHHPCTARSGVESNAEITLRFRQVSDLEGPGGRCSE